MCLYLVLFFKINVSSSHLHGLVFYSQVLSMPAVARTLLLAVTKEKQQSGYYWNFIIWDLETWLLSFFWTKYICLKSDTLLTLSLDLAVGVYPLLLMMLSYLLIKLYDSNFKPLVVIWKPFHTILGLFRRNWEIKTSLIDAFATFLLLSNVKFLSVSYDLLAPLKVILQGIWPTPGGSTMMLLWRETPSHMLSWLLWCLLCLWFSCVTACSIPFSLVPKTLKLVPLSLVHPTYLHGLIPRLLYIKMELSQIVVIVDGLPLCSSCCVSLEWWE